MNPIVIIISIFIAVFVTQMVIRKFPKQGKMGINIEPVSCPDCGKKAPKIRKPKNRKQLLWGGWTCEECGCEMDKYGKKENVT